MIVDASVILSAFFPDEAQEQAHAVVRDHVVGKLQLAAPTLLLYEVTNAVLQATRRKRITEEQASGILSSFGGMNIVLKPVCWQQILPLALRFDRSAYDAAYLALAEADQQPLMTGDSRLYHAVRAELDWVRWIGDYRRTG
jgi:predicted nucleic acid-binding protein